MLTRRSFFSMITGALGSWALPWKAKAATVCAAGQGPVYPAGVKMSIYQPIELLIDPRAEHINGEAGTWVTVDEHYSIDGKHLLTLFTLEGQDNPFWAEYEDRNQHPPQLGGVPCVRSTYEQALDVVLARYPQAIKGLRWILFAENQNWRSRRDRLLADYDPMAGVQWLSGTKEISIEEARRGWPIPTDLTCLKS